MGHSETCLTFDSVSFQLSASSSFAEDLGLDSLDAVEVVMAVEEVCSLYNSVFAYIDVVL